MKILLAVFAALMFLAPVVAAQNWTNLMPCSPGDERPCQSVGICQGATRKCIDGMWSQDCTGGVQPMQKEICDNGLDDDCNGLVDDCFSLSGMMGPLMIVSGVVLLIIALILSRIMK